VKAERWHQVKELLYAALECDVERRPALLDEACADDPELRREVEALIASHQQGKSFFEKPAMQAAAEWIDKDQEEAMVGRSLGYYRIEEKIGEGGMGVALK
jgi:serine/threonine-protein kinase